MQKIIEKVKNTKKLDVVVVNYNTLDCIKLFYYSIKHFNVGIDLNFIIRDNGSDDGSIEWLRSLDDVTLDIGDNTQQHGTCLTEIISKYSRNNYILISDSDVEFLDHGFIIKLLQKLNNGNVFAAHIGNDYNNRIITPIEIGYPARNPIGQNHTHIIEAIDVDRVTPTLCLWRGQILRNMLKYVTFGVYVGESSKVFYDTSSLISEVFRGYGLKDKIVDRKGYVKHYGKMTCLMRENPDEIKNKMNIIKEKVRKYENSF